MRDQLEPDRATELYKHAQLVSEIILETGQPLHEVPKAISELSRIALGIDPGYDIADMLPQTKSELLLVMRSVRDVVYPPRAD